MNRKSFFSSKSALYLWITAISFFFAVFIFSLIMAIVNINQHSIMLLGIILSIIFLIILICTIIISNRMVLKIYITEEKIAAKGLFGLHTECKIKDIVKICVYSYPREGSFITIIDNKQRSIDGFRKKSYIRFECTKENIEIVKSFWKDEIENLPK